MPARLGKSWPKDVYGNKQAEDDGCDRGGRATLLHLVVNGLEDGIPSNCERGAPFVNRLARRQQRSAGGRSGRGGCTGAGKIANAQKCDITPSKKGTSGNQSPLPSFIIRFSVLPLHMLE